MTEYEQTANDNATDGSAHGSVPHPPSHWLVKSGDRIQGPFSTEEIESRIRGKETAVIDEIASPCSRWRYVRDEPRFATAVEDIRVGLLNSREDTEIQGSAPNMHPHDKTPTEPTWLRDSAHAIAAKSHDSKSSSKSHGQTQASSSEARKIAENKDRKAFDEVTHPSLDFGGSRKKFRRRKSSKQWLWVGSLILALSIFAGFYAAKLNLFGSAAVDPEEDFGRLATSAERAWESGLFSEALSDYRKADSLSPGRPDIVARLAVLMMRLEGRTVEAKRLLEDVRPAAVEPSDRREVDLALGLAAMATEEFDDAEARFRAAQTNGSWIGAFNLGAVALNHKSTATAIGKFREAGEQSIAMFLLARSLIMMNEASLRSEALQVLEMVINRNGDFQQEAEISAAALEMEAGNVKKAAQFAQGAFDADPEATNDHFRSPFLAYEVLSWSALLPACRKIDEGLHSNLSRALLAICLAKAGERSQAEALLQSKLDRDPSEATLQSAMAYLLLSSGQDEAAGAAIRIIKENQLPRIGQITAARICSKKNDLACAEDAWSKLAAEPSPPLAALVGLADIRIKKHDLGGGGALLVKAQNISSTYLPLIRIRQEAR